MKQKGMAPWINSNAPVVCGAAAAAVCIYSLIQMRKAVKQIPSTPSPDIPVAVVYIQNPHRDFLQVLRNDVLLEKSVEKVSTRLYVFVDDSKASSTSERLQYLGEVYNLLWNFACCAGKYNLDMRVMSSTDRSWNEVLLAPELDGVFGCDDLDVTQLNKERSDRRVVFHPLTQYVDRGVDPHTFIYLEDDQRILGKEALVVIGGTFDYLHNGHKKLLSHGAALANNGMLIGVTAPHMLEKKSLGYLIETLETRKQNVQEYLATMFPHVEATIVTIDDPFGPSITSAEVTAIVVSTETQLGAVKINAIRQERQLHPLRIYVCRRTDASTLSSSFIREQLAKRR
ncbi:hypothetical protein Ae201684P_011521 [Aphanomyces euteiches]|uniref:Cytidyltransferase-like domain-containing protein n=1 Tax=Aphanomyces euteiches TaxID=100861 RepID=A0A6G0XX61_9STRA|nr:hypothetical protein Ae201684_000650 [Aphanomyces euteiches]KAH9091981.1 hypothetical protein Ae201684P_011521 [Aphanomyces euteiches]KAH9144162.1 hypothetical protein AeRB84_011867 [Aphanomyces euteiches]